MTDRELMQMALDALEKSRVFVTTREKAKHPEGTEWYDERIEALRARLAQPEQEPVAWMHDSHVGFNVPLYTAPPQANDFNPDWDAIPVMVEEQQRMAKRIEELESQLGEAMWGYGEWRRKAEISSALCTRQGIRLMEYESQEPVAWMVKQSKRIPHFFEDKNAACVLLGVAESEVIPLYTAPPQRELKNDE